MRIGISTACFYPYVNTEDTLDIIKDLGFDLCEVFIEALSETNEDFCHSLKSKADKLGIEIYSIHAFNATFEPFLFDRYDRRRLEMEDRFRDVCKAGKILGASFYTFHGLTSSMPGHNIEKISSTMNRLYEIAGSYNIGLSQENVSWCKSGDPEYLRELKANMNKELFYTLDIKQAVRSNREPFEYLELYGNRLSTVHINDASNISTCLLPGKGEIDLKEIIKRVSTINPDIPYIIEVYSENYKQYDELKEARDYLSQLFINE